jgi:hypothetical protein
MPVRQPAVSARNDGIDAWPLHLEHTIRSTAGSFEP